MSIPSLQLGGEIIRRSNAKGKAISNLSLQKLAYFCHGWNLALFDEPLADEEFEAWKFGPVLPTLYHTFKPFSSNAIPAHHALVSWIPGLPPGHPAGPLIDRVLDVYGNFSSAQLVHYSHLPDGPWHPVYYDDTSPNSVIRNDLIKDYFLKLRK